MRKGMATGQGKGYKNIQGRDPAVHSQSAKGISQPQKISTIQPVILTPSVNSLVVSTSLFGNFGRKGKRLEGYSDPAHKMSWVEWEDGTRSGEFTKDLVSPKTFEKIQENLEKPRESFEVYKIMKGDGSFFNAKEVEIPSSDNPEAELKKRFPNHRFMKVGTVTRAKEDSTHTATSEDRKKDPYLSADSKVLNDSKYELYVPPTMEQGSYSIRIDNKKDALWHYNSAREHDGLPPLKRMPKGTKYNLIKRIPKTIIEFNVQGNYGQGWEDVTAEAKRSEARARLKEYNENENYPHRLIARRIKNPAYNQISNKTYSDVNYDSDETQSEIERRNRGI